MLQHPCNKLTQKPFVSRGGLHLQKSVARDKYYYDVIASRPCEAAFLRSKLQSLQKIQSTCACVCSCYRLLSFFDISSCTWEYEGAYQSTTCFLKMRGFWWLSAPPKHQNKINPPHLTRDIYTNSWPNYIKNDSFCSWDYPQATCEAALWHPVAYTFYWQVWRAQRLRIGRDWGLLWQSGY